MDEQLQKRMGDGLREKSPVSIQGMLQYWQAERLSLPQGLFWSQVDVTDVSFWQGRIDFWAMKRSGISGVIIRAGQNKWKDKCFDVNWRDAKAYRLPRGSYWFYDSREDPKNQADLYRETLGNDLGELPVVVDYEDTYNGPFKGWKRLYDFIERLVSKGRVPRNHIMIYTGYWYWMANSPQKDPAALNYFKKYPLWLASYTTNPKRVRIPRPWTDADVKLWQWGTPAEGLARGVQSKEIDMNKFLGDEEDYTAWLEALK